jgi:hypothetical protein
MMPNYCQYIHHLINHVVPTDKVPRCERVTMNSISLSLQGPYVEVPEMMPPEGQTKARHDPMFASDDSTSHHGPCGRSSPVKGASKFFKYLFGMCKSYDVIHKTLALAQETRRRHDQFLTERNLPVSPRGPEMDPVPYQNFVMPSIDDAMFHGFEISRLPPFVSNSAPCHSRTVSDDDDDGSGSGSGSVSGSGDQDEENEETE